MSKHDHAKHIDALGGQKVQNHFGVGRQVVNNWRVRGIPMGQLARFAELAAAEGLALTGDFLGPLNLPDGFAPVPAARPAAERVAA